MAERPIWRGHLRLALVSCPVALYSAHHERANLHFHFINPEAGHRVRMITQDAETEQELFRRDLVRGYEFKKDNYLVLTDEDFESVKVESSTLLNVEKFVSVDSIDPIYFESSYYMVPDGDAGQDVYVVLREAIARTKRVALSRVVIARRERAVAIMPIDRGLVAHTLCEQRDLHDPHELFAGIPAMRPEADMVALATQLVDRQTGRFDPADVEDRYEARLRDLIEAKLRGEGIEPEEEEDQGNVIDLMAALKRSLAAAEPRKPASATARKVVAKPPTKKSSAKTSKPPSQASTGARQPSGKPVRKRA
jgi:DNA end-binding protein Ku